MSKNDFFPLRPEAHPKIYAYSIDAPNRKGLLKGGYTVRDEQTQIKKQVKFVSITSKRLQGR